MTKLSAPPVPVAKEEVPASTEDGEGNGDWTPSRERHWTELSRKELAQERRSLLMKLFADTGTAKIPAVLRCVQDKIGEDSRRRPPGSL